MEKYYEVRCDFAGNVRRDFALDAAGDVFLRTSTWHTPSGTPCGPGAINGTFREGKWEFFKSHAAAKAPGESFLGSPSPPLWNSFVPAAVERAPAAPGDPAGTGRGGRSSISRLPTASAAIVCCYFT